MVNKSHLKHLKGYKHGRNQRGVLKSTPPRNVEVNIKILQDIVQYKFNKNTLIKKCNLGISKVMFPTPSMGS